MNHHGRRLKRCMSQAAFGCNVPFQVLLHNGLRDFMIDGFDDESSPQEIAVSALSSLCSGDPSKKLLDMTIAIAVDTFLYEISGLNASREHQVQRLKDLYEVIQSKTVSYAAWVDSWYR